MALELSSSAFPQGGTIPSLYTCDGNNYSPPLAWKDLPSGTKSLVLIVNDPDAPAGTWDHWILYNLNPQVSSLAENLLQPPTGALFGKNSWGKVDYGGPCPPNGEHRYFFKLYALDSMLPAVKGLTRQQVEQAINGHVIAVTQLMARYQRSN